MLIKIPNILSREELTVAHDLINKAGFVDGKLSAGNVARMVKKNEEINSDASELEQLNNLVMGNLLQNPAYQNGALPLRIAAPYYARYTAGMSYGDHIDDPIMYAQAPYRSDIAITVFLTEPSDYEGGELVIRTSFGESEVKYSAGDAVMYPASSLHHVNEVTKGERIVAVTWVQSIIRDPAKRDLLYELNEVREKMLAEIPETEESKKIDKTYVNLVRMWSEV